MDRRASIKTELGRVPSKCRSLVRRLIGSDGDDLPINGSALSRMPLRKDPAWRYKSRIVIENTKLAMWRRRPC